MPRPKGSKNKPKGVSTIDALGTLTKHLQALGVTSEDLSNHYKKGSPYNQTDLIQLFAKYKPELEKMQIPITRGRSAGSFRALKEDEILLKFAEKIAMELGKVSPVSTLLQRLSEQAKDKPLKF